MIRQPLQMAVGGPKQGSRVNSRLWDIVAGDVLTGVLVGSGVFDRNRLPVTDCHCGSC